MAARRRGSILGMARTDKLFEFSVMAVAGLTLALVWLLVAKMILDAQQSISEFGVGFVTGDTWDPNRDAYGALPFIFGTLVTSAIAILIGVPVSIGIAIYLSELAPPWIRDPLSFVVELLAAVPRGIYGLWALCARRPVWGGSIE